MAITREDVLHVAALARLEIPEGEVEGVREQLGAILEAVGKVSELDLADVEPTSHPLDLVNQWAEDEPRFQGKHYQLRDVTFFPKPVQKPHPPIWIGGRSDQALRRAARVGDGWVSYVVTAERYRASLEKIEAWASEAGRPLDLKQGFEPAHVAFTVIDDDWERARATAARSLTKQYNQPFDELVKRYCVLGPPARCIETLEGFVEAGARTFVLGFMAGADRAQEQIERFASEALPALR